MKKLILVVLAASLLSGCDLPTKGTAICIYDNTSGYQSVVKYDNGYKTVGSTKAEVARETTAEEFIFRSEHNPFLKYGGTVSCKLIKKSV